jgi:hypothetical protein
MSAWCFLGFIAALEVGPVSWISAERLGKPMCHGRSHAALASQDFHQGIWRHTDVLGKPARTQAEGFQVVTQDFTGMDGKVVGYRKGHVMPRNQNQNDPFVAALKRNPRFYRIIGCGQSGAAILTVHKPGFG